MLVLSVELAATKHGEEAEETTKADGHPRRHVAVAISVVVGVGTSPRIAPARTATSATTST